MLYERLDGPTLAKYIRQERERVTLCAPGFGDDEAAALIDAHGRFDAGQVTVVIDGPDQGARLGYGHFDGVDQLAQAGVALRVEPGCAWAPW